MPNRVLVRNAALNEFVWTLLYNISPEQKKNLSAPFLRILKSSVKSKYFAEFSSLDEKVRLFSELGYDNALVFFEDKANSVKALKPILEKYEADRQAAAGKDIVQLKCFVSSDKQVKWLLGLMADTIHHKSFFLNLEYNRIGHHLKSWESRRLAASTKELSDTMDSADLLAKTFLNCFHAESFLEGFIGVNSLDLQILLYLYGYRHTYIEKQRIWDYFAGIKTKTKITSSLKRLFLTDNLKKHIDYSIPKYTITGKGLDLVNQYMNRVIKQNSF